MKKIGFVIPWFAENIPGGAEAELRGLTAHMAQAGVELEILTTCVREFSADWNVNYYPQGIEMIGKVPVRRFPVRKRDTVAFDGINIKLMNGLPLSAIEEETFVREMINSPALCEYLKIHQEEYQAYAFIPYMFGTTYYGCQVCPQKTVLIPCLHDESYAYLNVFRRAFSQVAGMAFLAEPEGDLAKKLYDLSQVDARVLGAGVDTDWCADPKRFREKYGWEDTPFLLYAGRKDAGKNVDTLVQYFAEFKKRNPGLLKLLLLGGGKIDIPQEAKGDIVDLGFLPLQDKYDAYAACTAFCNPSLMESFSIVIMESWLATRPVLVHGACAVTRHFAITSEGGLYFENYFEFEGALRYLLEHPQMADQMGQNGRKFVLENFSWEKIVEKYCRLFADIPQERNTETK